MIPHRALRIGRLYDLQDRLFPPLLVRAFGAIDVALGQPRPAPRGSARRADALRRKVMAFRSDEAFGRWLWHEARLAEAHRLYRQTLLLIAQLSTTPDEGWYRAAIARIEADPTPLRLAYEAMMWTAE